MGQSSGAFICSLVGGRCALSCSRPSYHGPARPRGRRRRSGDPLGGAPVQNRSGLPWDRPHTPWLLLSGKDTRRSPETSNHRRGRASRWLRLSSLLNESTLKGRDWPCNSSSPPRLNSQPGTAWRGCNIYSENLHDWLNEGLWMAGSTWVGCWSEPVASHPGDLVPGSRKPLRRPCPRELRAFFSCVSRECMK